MGKERSAPDSGTQTASNPLEAAGCAPARRSLAKAQFELRAFESARRQPGHSSNIRFRKMGRSPGALNSRRVCGGSRRRSAIRDPRSSSAEL